MLLNPWKVARKAYKPPSQGTATLERLGFWRSVLGFATIVFVSLDTRQMSEIVDDTGANVLRNTILGMLAIPVSVAVVYFLTHRPARPELRLWPVAGRLILLIVTVFLPVYLVTEFLIGKRLPFEDATEVNVVNVVGVLLMLGLLLWWPVYLLCGIYWAGRTYCWIGEFHPLLAPTVTAIMTTILTTLDLASTDTKGLAVDVWLVITLSGLASTVWLAVAEYRKIVQMGVGWRTGPNPAASLNRA